MKETQKKTTLKISLAIAVFILLAVLVKADSYELYCVQPGQTVDLKSLCNPAMDNRNGPITLCMHLLDNGKICPVNLNTCNSLGLTCSSNSSTVADVEPPTLQILSPLPGSIHTQRSVLLNLIPSEQADIAFIDNNDDRGRWTSVCSNCNSYSKSRSFTEGPNNIQFRVKDGAGNENYYNLTFYIDSKDPKIKSASPQKGFASGLFKVEFTEDNPKNLTIKYGNTESGMLSKQVDINSSCIKKSVSITACETQVNLAAYDGESIEYWFELKDIAGNSAQSKVQLVFVDYTPPVINNFNFTVNGKDVTFSMEISEINFKDVSFYDESEMKPKWKILCNKLVGGACTKKVGFADGEHNVTVRATDLAGGFSEIQVSFFADSKRPKIARTDPKKGFAPGDFEVQFIEENPETLNLFINSGPDTETHSLNLQNDCIAQGAGKQNCLISVDMSPHNGEIINYWFEITDRVGQKAISRPIWLNVDTTFPTINSINHTLSGNKAEIAIDFSEEYLRTILYINNNDAVPREKTFCSLSGNGVCKKTIVLNSGTNNLQFTITDKAGNSVSQNYQIVV